MRPWNHLFILMEKSPREFHEFSDQYIHERQISYSSGLQLPSLSHITYISLDTFNSMGQNIVTELDAWLTFFSCTDGEHIVRLVQEYPKFLEYYKDIAVFRTKPKELIYMFSEALEILDRNTANYMIDELAQEVKSVKEELDSAKSELDSAKSELDSTKSELDSARKDSAAKDEEIAKLKAQIEALEQNK